MNEHSPTMPAHLADIYDLIERMSDPCEQFEWLHTLREIWHLPEAGA